MANTCKTCGYLIDDNAEMAVRIDGVWAHASSRYCWAAREAYAVRNADVNAYMDEMERREYRKLDSLRVEY